MNFGNLMAGPILVILESAESGNQSCWSAPSGNNLKINVDGAFKKDGRAGIGIIIRDNLGTMLDRFAFKVHASYSFMSEAIALRKGVQIAKSLDLKDCCFDFDNFLKLLLVRRVALIGNVMLF